MIRSWRNRITPINQIPPEILALIPDFWDVDKRDEDVIALTHVCRGWRELFVSCPSLWANLDCVDEDKTRVYVERSKSSPISLSLHSDYVALRDLFEFIPGITGRLRSLDINLDPEDLQLVSVHLSRRAPLLEVLSIRSCGDPVLSSVLFDGDLSSLRELHLREIRTKLPWRNMVNLTSFTLTHESPISVNRFLDFFESAPRLREIGIISTIPISGARMSRNERLVPLACLQKMDTSGYPSHLFDHLLIPVGARLDIRVDLPSPRIGDRPPRFIDNLKNLSSFTTIQSDSRELRIRFSGPNGEVGMNIQGIGTRLLVEFLAHFDTSKTERLEIIGCHGSSVGNPVYQTLLPMKDLRTLKFDQCNEPQTFLRALHPGMSLSGAVVCPELEELVIMHGWAFNIKNVVAVAAARASRGAKLKFVKIVHRHTTIYSQPDVLELKEHVLHVECDC